MAKSKSKKLSVPPGYKEVFTAFITLRNGRRIYASWYGLKAFRLLVRI